jgi:catechol 2,3-dioxygenase-like lactoylglutathione lyase family enzyme
MPIARIESLYLETNHWDRSVAFWKGLGFTVARQWGEDGHRACHLESNSARITLAELGDRSHLPDRPTPYFEVSDIETIDRELASSNDVSVLVPLEKTHWGTRWIRVQDPDGNIYALQARDGAPPSNVRELPESNVRELPDKG